MRAVGRVTVTFMVDTLMCVAASELEADLDKLEEEVEHGYLGLDCFCVSFWISMSFDFFLINYSNRVT